MDILTIYDKLIDNLTEIALLMNRKVDEHLDESLSGDLSELAVANRSDHVQISKLYQLIWVQNSKSVLLQILVTN